MDNLSELKVGGGLLAMHFVVAYLLAREVARSGDELETLHATFVRQVTSSIERVDEENITLGEFKGGLEATVTNELDSIFSLAYALRRLMK